MAKKDTVRFAPIRDGQLLATPWRLFCQGDEVYFGSSDLIRTGAGKFSLHRSGNWVATLGHVSQKMLPGVQFDGTSWLHAAEIIFFLEDSVGTAETYYRGSWPVTAIDVPPSHKLVIDVWLGPQESKAPPKLPPNMQGLLIWHAKLRSAGAVAAVARVIPFGSEEDLKNMAWFRGQDLRTGVAASSVRPPHVEFVHLRFRDPGNFVAVYVVAPKAVGWQEKEKPAP